MCLVFVDRKKCILVIYMMSRPLQNPIIREGRKEGSWPKMEART